MVRQELGVVPDTPDEGGAPPRLQWQSEEIDSGFCRNAAPMLRLARFVARVDLQPAEIHSEAGCPDDRGDSGLGQVQRPNGIGHAPRVWADLAGLWLQREIEAIARDKGVGFIQYREIVRVTLRDIIRKVLRKGHHTVFEGFRLANQRHPLRSEAPEVDRLAATGAAYRDRDMSLARVLRLAIPFAEPAQPPDEVTFAIGARRTVMGTDREIDSPSRALEFIRDLHT